MSEVLEQWLSDFDHLIIEAEDAGAVRRLAEEIRAEEREACAKLCDAVAKKCDEEGANAFARGFDGDAEWAEAESAGAQRCARAVRSGLNDRSGD